MRVDIIILTYNQRLFVKECLSSALSQDYTDVSITVCDDCSTDGTRELLRYLNQEWKFNLILNKSNLGITDNMRIGLEKTSGDLFCFVGGDDILYSSKVTEQVAHFRRNLNLKISYHNMLVYDQILGTKVGHFNLSVPFVGDVSDILKKGTINCGSSTMYKRSEGIEKYLDNRLSLACDWFFNISFLANGGEIEYIDQVLGIYRRHDNNVTVRMPNSETLQRNDLDILITPLLVMETIPNLKKYAEIGWSKVRYEYRHYLDYPGAVFYRWTKTRDIVYLLFLFIYIFSLGKIKK